MTAAKKKKNILVLDVGTTGVKAFVFDAKLKPLSRVYAPLGKKFPKKGFVEQDPLEILKVSEKVLREAVRQSGVPVLSIGRMGITNQRETTILWDKVSGKPAYPAIVWEDSRTTRQCGIFDKEFGRKVRQKTGLNVDSYFSASKVAWILENSAMAKDLLAQKRLAFGTVDSWLLWNLLEDRPHITDYTNASRTLLFDIKKLSWDKSLLGLWEVPAEILPKAVPSMSDLGLMREKILGAAIPVSAVAGDQQSSMYAAGEKRGSTKVTYGTGTFISQIIGPKFAVYPKLFTTLAPTSGKKLYAVEGKIGGSGEKIAALLKKGEDLRPTVEEIAAQTAEFLKYMPVKPKEIIVDGGITKYKNLVSIQAKAAGLPVRKQKIYDGTAYGVAKMLR